MEEHSECYILSVPDEGRHIESKCTVLVMHSMLDSPPRTYDEAKTRVDGSLWLAAMQSEMNSVQALDTWYPVQRVPGMKVLPVRWVMNKKLDEKGDVAQYKARIVAKGFM